MAKRGRPKGSKNQKKEQVVTAHLFWAETMAHAESFKGTSQDDVRQQIQRWIDGNVTAGDKMLVLWGMGELITIAPMFAPVVEKTFDEDFFYSAYTDDDEL